MRQVALDSSSICRHTVRGKIAGNVFGKPLLRMNNQCKRLPTLCDSGHLSAAGPFSLCHAAHQRRERYPKGLGDEAFRKQASKLGNSVRRNRLAKG
jgi:hypothetical protein